MKKIFIILPLIAVILASCSSKKKEQETVFLRPPSITLCAQDTIDIMKQVEDYVALFGKNKLEEASQKLYFVRNDSVFPLTKEKKEGFVKGLSTFHIYKSKVEHLIIRNELNNEVSVILQVIENGDIDKGVGITRFFLNPVKVNNKWYITLRDKYAEGVARPY